MSEKITVYEVVYKLIGPIEPVGETGTDNMRFENLKAMTELVELLVTDIDEVAMLENRHEYSVKRAGEFASKYLTKDLGIPE